MSKPGNISDVQLLTYARDKVLTWLKENSGLNHRKELFYTITADNIYFRMEVWSNTGKTCEYLFFHFNLADYSLRVYTQIDQVQ